MEKVKYIQNNVSGNRCSVSSSLAKESEFVRTGKRVAREHAGTLRRLAKS